MKNVAMVVSLAGIALSGAFGTAAHAGGPPGADGRTYVSREQYRVLLAQCRYADTPAMRADCRTRTRQRYAVGTRPLESLDCRTYSGVTVCGELTLSVREQNCVRQAVDRGLTFRRAEVECYAFY